VLESIAGARAGAIEEGAVGAGTGMTCYGWKGGIGTSSRVVAAAGRSFTVGALVLANFGRPADLTVRGTPVGRRLEDRQADSQGEAAGSIVCVLATDAPFDSRQLGRLARRAQNGIARTGGDCEHGSGEFVIAFSTTHAYGGDSWLDVPELMNPTFRAVAATVEESILNALCTAVSVTGRAGRTVAALPVEEVRELLEEKARPAGEDPKR
jgi:D-aminopeptidase